MIELFHDAGSSHSASVRIALAEKGLAYADRPVDLARLAQHAPDFLAINPAGQVPVLRDVDHTLTEAFFILLYLDEAHPQPPLGGATPRERYAVQKWGKYVETHIAPHLAILSWTGTGTTPDRLDQLPPERRALWTKALAGFGIDEVDRARAALATAAERIAEDLAEQDWLTGAGFGLADIAVYPHAARFAGLGIAVPDAVAEWLDRVASRPTVDRVDATATMGPEPGRWG